MAGRIVAELGRPETPQETADRKAAGTAAYRASKTFRSLLAGVLVTVVLLVAIVLIVPRGQIAEPEQRDARAIATQLSDQLDRNIYALSAVPAQWQVNGTPSRSQDSGASVWKVVYSPTKENTTDTGFVTLEQAFDSDSDWAGIALTGSKPGETVTIDGHEWTTFEMSDALRSKNVTRAYGAQAGTDYVLLYGNASDAKIREFAADLTAQFDSPAKEDAE